MNFYRRGNTISNKIANLYMNLINTDTHTHAHAHTRITSYIG